MKRNPSWTDRILFSCSCDHKNKDLCRLEQKSYDSNNLVTLSDHRPVHAQFTYKLELSKQLTDHEGDCNPILRSVAQETIKKDFARARRVIAKDRVIGAKTLRTLTTEQIQQNILLRKQTGEISQVRTKACAIF